MCINKAAIAASPNSENTIKVILITYPPKIPMKHNYNLTKKVAMVFTSGSCLCQALI